jgi:hypothetical protein
MEGVVMKTRVCFFLAAGLLVLSAAAGRAQDPAAHEGPAPAEASCEGAACCPACYDCWGDHGLRRVWGWLTYRRLPSPKGCGWCKCVGCCRPPLYAYFVNTGWSCTENCGYGHGGWVAPPVAAPVHP